MNYQAILERYGFINYGYRHGHAVWQRTNSASSSTEVAVWPCGKFRIWPTRPAIYTPRGTNEVSLEAALIALDTLRHSRPCSCDANADSIRTCLRHGVIA